MRIHIPSHYPPESLVLFVMSTWHVLIALLISRVGVLRREPVNTSGDIKATEVNALATVPQRAGLQQQSA